MCDYGSFSALLQFMIGEATAVLCTSISGSRGPLVPLRRCAVSQFRRALTGNGGQRWLQQARASALEGAFVGPPVFCCCQDQQGLRQQSVPQFWYAWPKLRGQSTRTEAGSVAVLCGRTGKADMNT